MTDAELALWTRYTLYAMGAIFLWANIRVTRDLVRWARRRSSALLVWPARKPPYYGLSLAVGVMLGLLILVKAYVQFRRTSDVWLGLTMFGRSAFGELMMFVFYGYALPLSTRIGRGLYADGVWTDTGFMRYRDIGALRWKEGERATLVFASRLRALARSLEVPNVHIGEVRRLLRDRISSHMIDMGAGPGLHLGARDARDSV